jgi:flagellar hook-associated protein 3 FlgL
MLSRSVLSDIQDVSAKLQHEREKLSSGKDIVRPSDDPFRASRALAYRSEVAENMQYQRAITEADGWQTVTDTALRSIGDALLRVRELVVQGANGSTSANDRQVIARELQTLIDGVKSDSNAVYAGRYVFAGAATLTAPYTTADDAYHGDNGTVHREIGPGVQLGVNVVGAAVVGDASSGVIATLRQVVTDLQANNVGALSADLTAVDAAHDAVITARADVGTRVNRLDAAQARLSELEEATRSLMSENEDADMAKTYVEVSTQQAVYQSALRAGANIVQMSLLDFLR